MAHHMDMLRAQLEAYAATWKLRTDARAAEWELQLQVRLAIDLYDLVSAAMEHRGPEAHRRKGEERDSFLRESYELCRIWFEPSKQLLKLLNERSKSAYVFEGMTRLEKLCHDTEWYLAADPQRMIQALKDVDEGRMIRLQELRDELRRRAGAAVRG